MTELPPPGEDFASWSAVRWSEIAPDADSSAALVAIRFMRIATALDQSHARVIREWKAEGVASIDDFRLLGLLRHIGSEGTRPQYIAHQLRGAQGTISSRIARLEKHGLVERFADPVDGRARLVRLNPDRAPLVDDMYRSLVVNHEQFFRALSSTEHTQLSELLGQLNL